MTFLRICFLFAFLGASSLIWSCAKALDAWVADKYFSTGSEPKALRWLISVLLFIGWFGIFAHPFEAYLNSRLYDHMARKARAVRCLYSSSQYPSSSECNFYGFEDPSSKVRQQLQEVLNICAAHGFSPIGSYEYKEFLDWREREYRKLNF